MNCFLYYVVVIIVVIYNMYINKLYKIMINLIKKNEGYV